MKIPLSHSLFPTPHSLFSRQWSRIAKFVSLFCVCLLLVVSCAGGQQTTTSSGSGNTPSGDGRITVGTSLKPRTLDPADAYELSSLGLLYNMSDRLYYYEPGTTKITPQLATGLPKVSQDGLIYTIPLRQGVVFHDDTPFNAQAMAFSIERFIKNGGKPSFLLSDVVDTVKATGEYELTIKLKKPFAAFPSLLAFPGVCPLSPKAYELGTGKFKPNIFVGTGPYKLAQYGTDSLRFDLFDKYWGKNPVNKGINLQILTSPANLFNSFRTGAVDVAYLSLEPDQIRSLDDSAKKRDWQSIQNQGSVVSYLVLNRNQKPLERPEIRQAIASIIDRPVINERVLFNQAEPLYSMIPTTFDVSLPLFKDKYGDGNVEKAKQLITSAGFSKQNPLRVAIWYPSSSPTRSLAAEILKGYAEEKMDGLLQFEINTVEGATFFKSISKGLYPAALLDWYPDFIDADNYIQPFLECPKGSDTEGCKQGGSQTQGSFYYSEKVNKLIEQQRKEQNLEVRKKIFADIQAQVATDVPYVPLWQNKDYAFARKGVSGVELNPNQILVYETIKK